MHVMISDLVLPCIHNRNILRQVPNQRTVLVEETPSSLLVLAPSFHQLDWRATNQALQTESLHGGSNVHIHARYSSVTATDMATW